MIADPPTLTALGDTVRLTARVQDQNGQLMAGAAVNWTSSHASVATVNASGLVTAKGDGEALITATSGTASGGAAITIEREASAVVVTPAEATLAVGDTIRLWAEVHDAEGAPIADAVITWGTSHASGRGQRRPARQSSSR